MPDPHHFLQNLALILCVAAATTLLFQRLRQPVVFGYLLAGMIIGPHIPVPLVADEALVRTLAELGVVLLIFALGLEFSLRKLFRVGPTAGFIAVLQSSAMVLVGYSLGQAFGWTPLESVYTGAVIAISSTTIIVKAFAEQKIGGRVSEIVFGILIIEDLIAIILLAILTAASTPTGVTAAGLVTTGLRLGGFLLGLIVVGLLVVPRLVRAAVKLDRPETTLVTVVGICFATALLALSFGYSVALGAFIGGSLVAESGEARRIEHLVAPVRDMFAAIFFVAVGMLIDPVLIARHWGAVAVLTVAVIVGKVVAVSIGAFLAGYGTRTSVQTGMSLAQIGEFSFIIAGIGLSTGATRPFLYPVAVAVSAITTLTTPWLIRGSGPAASWIDRTMPRPLQTFAALYETWLERLHRRQPAGARSRVRRLIWLLLADVAILMTIVAIAAVELETASEALVGTFGWSVTTARRTVMTGAAALSLPLLAGFFSTSQRLGLALASEVLPAVAPGKVDLGAAPRRALTVTLQLAIVAVIGIPLLAIARPFLPPLGGTMAFFLVVGVLAVTWWRSAIQLQGHAQAGAEVIVSTLMKQMATEPHDGEPASGIRDAAELASVNQLIPGLGEPVALLVEPEHHAVGKTLATLDLRSRTGAMIMAISRQGEHILLPSGHETLRAGDVLAIAGTHGAVTAAGSLLKRGVGSTA